MARIKFGLISIFVFLMSSCTKSEKLGESKQLDHDMSRATIDVELPSALWDRIDSTFKSGIKAKEEPKEEKKSESKSDSKPSSDLLIEEMSKEYVPLTVHLIEKSDNKGILQGHDHQLYFASGGGVLDLADFVENRRGSYYLKVDFGRGKYEGDSDPTKDFSKENIKVFYLSNSRRRKWEGKIIGSGCTKYFDISSFFEKSMKSEGFLLNTTDHLDVTTLSGSFFFAAQINKTLYISQLSIKDSRFNSLQCHPMLNKVESL